MIGSVLRSVTDAVGGFFDYRTAKTAARREVELERISSGAHLDSVSAGDMSSSWKDEWLTVIFTTPVAVVFYASVWGDPNDIVRVHEAFDAMTKLPEWYHWILLGIVSGTFGLRTLSKWRSP